MPPNRKLWLLSEPQTLLRHYVPPLLPPLLEFLQHFRPFEGRRVLSDSSPRATTSASTADGRPTNRVFLTQKAPRLRILISPGMCTLYGGKIPTRQETVCSVCVCVADMLQQLIYGWPMATKFPRKLFPRPVQSGGHTQEAPAAPGSNSPARPPTTSARQPPPLQTTRNARHKNIVATQAALSWQIYIRDGTGQEIAADITLCLLYCLRFLFCSNSNQDVSCAQCSCDICVNYIYKKTIHTCDCVCCVSVIKVKNRVVVLIGF